MPADRLLVLGGASSGKTRYAQERAVELGGDDVTFIATARRGDPELDARIARHRAERPAPWRTYEVVEDLTGAIEDASSEHVLLIDSIALWVATLLERRDDVQRYAERAIAALDGRERPVILVSDEVGLGLVPPNALARAFVDQLGWVDQRLASVCREVRLVVAGIAVPVKTTP